MSNDILAHEYLRECLHYSVITGEFYWLKAPSNKVKLGSMAGSLNVKGYRQIKINGTLHRAHRLVWLWVTGKWPVNEIDHVNGVRNANYWLNLREATHSQNAMNRGMLANNTSSFKGVFWNKRAQKWMGQINLNSRRIHLGYFDAIEDACAARTAAEERLHGEFARPLDVLEL